MARKKTISKTRSIISRREFARNAALAAAAAAVLPSNLAATAEAVLPQAAQDQAPLSRETQAEVEFKIQAIVRKYGDRLNDAQRADIRRLATEGQKPIETLRAYTIANSDQPGTVLKLYPETPVTPQAAAPAKIKE